MLFICVEIDKVVVGDWLQDNNLLVNVLYIVEDLISIDWEWFYICEEVCYLVGSFCVDKYWSLVNCVDNVYGDWNFVCICLLLEEYLDVVE